jgi:hypothetical protein
MTFIPIIIVIHIYNWYHSITTSIPLYTWARTWIMYKAYSPCFFFPLADSLLLPFLLSTYLEPSLLWQDPSTSFPGCSWTNFPISLTWLLPPTHKLAHSKFLRGILQIINFSTMQRKKRASHPLPKPLKSSKEVCNIFNKNIKWQN